MKIQPKLKNIHAHLLMLIDRKEPVALATIIDTRGSSPQVPGASALISPEGLLFGTVGGGELEAEIERAVVKALETKNSCLFRLSLDTDIETDEGAICGGEVMALVDASPGKNQEAFNGLVQSLRLRNPGILATLIDKISEDKVVVNRSWLERKQDFSYVKQKPLFSFQEELERTLYKAQPKLLNLEEKTPVDKNHEHFLFLEPLFPLPQLVIAGAGHIGQALAHLGHLLEFEVIVTDDRPEYANSKRLPDADSIIVGEIGEALGDFPIVTDTYVVIVTRGHRHDAEALRACVGSQAAYIGVIGSRSKIQQMRQQFLGQGWATQDQFDKVYAPIGLDIRSKTVEEIATSIAAQLVLVRSQSQSQPELG